MAERPWHSTAPNSGAGQFRSIVYPWPKGRRHNYSLTLFPQRCKCFGGIHGRGAEYGESSFHDIPPFLPVSMAERPCFNYGTQHCELGDRCHRIHGRKAVAQYGNVPPHKLGLTEGSYPWPKGRALIAALPAKPRSADSIKISMAERPWHSTTSLHYLA